MATKINTDKIVKLTPTFWKNLGDKKIKVAVQKDMEDGVMQNGKSNLNYKSMQYKKYKSNDMRRFTDGKRLKSISAQTIESNQTGYVNMILTGHTKRGLKVISSNKTGVNMGFESADAGKILGNQKKGYDIVGLNEKNISMVEREILKQFDKNEKKLKNITIHVKI